MMRFPVSLSIKIIAIYFCALLIANLYFAQYALSVHWVLFGISATVFFFVSLNILAEKWGSLGNRAFICNLFLIALVFRILYVLFIYHYYIDVTNSPLGYSDADAAGYDRIARYLANNLKHGHWDLYHQIQVYLKYMADLSDTGYVMYLSIVYAIFDDSMLASRLLKTVISAYMCVFIYKLARRNFGEQVGRLSGIIALLMPHFFYYCGVNLKETEMIFLSVVFLERSDHLLKSKKYSWTNVLVPVLCGATLFFFRTVLALTAFFSFFSALIILSGKYLRWGKRLLLTCWMALVLGYIAGGRILLEIDNYWNMQATNQQAAMQERAEYDGGNQFVKYASGMAFAPVILVIPFPTIVEVPKQSIIKMRSGDYYVKNALAFFAMLGLYLIFKEKTWRRYALIGSFLVGYLIIVSSSAFVHSERFHLPALSCFIIFAAYGISRMRQRYIRWFNIYLIFLFFVMIGWAWFKLSGRGMV